MSELVNLFLLGNNLYSSEVDKHNPIAEISLTRKNKITSKKINEMLSIVKLKYILSYGESGRLEK